MGKLQNFADTKINQVFKVKSGTSIQVGGQEGRGQYVWVVPSRVCAPSSRVRAPSSCHAAPSCREQPVDEATGVAKS